MKKITFTLGLILALILTACSGSDGLDGRDGIDGVNITGNIYEIEGDFTPDNEYSLYYKFPNGANDIEIFESDVVLVYILWDQKEDNNGEAVDIWRLLPQTRLLDQGILQYNYEHTFLDTTIFLEADFNLNTLTYGDTDNQIFRIAILPAEKASGKLNKNNITDVMGVLGVKETDIVRTTID